MLINILGLGPSLDLYIPDENISIGVNDIWAYHISDYIVCVDEPDRFTEKRLKVITESRPVKFYSQLDCYSERPDFEKIELQPYYPNYKCYLNTPGIPKSHCSPFVAACIAFKIHKATEIHLYGVDLLNHPNLNSAICNDIKDHFKNLKIALRQNGSDLIVHGSGILKNI